MMGFRENLRALREARGWSMRELADRAGVPMRTYQKWEMGAAQPKLDGVKKLLKVFGVSFTTLTKD
jgi:transcriptional regulator with XRE-family HTH domain